MQPIWSASKYRDTDNYTTMYILAVPTLPASAVEHKVICVCVGGGEGTLESDCLYLNSEGSIY